MPTSPQQGSSPPIRLSVGERAFLQNMLDRSSTSGSSGDGHTEDSISPPREQSAVEDFHSVAETPGGRRRRIYDVNDGHIHEDETAARRELEDNIGCKVRSKGSPYVRKDGSRVRKYVCSYADRKGWKRCRFGALIVERATDGRFEIEAESIHPPHEPSGEAMPRPTPSRV
ncbi:hypothetical protein FOZ60_007407 [Perkinsus olseni]|uniref:Uncharacterized protein n=1 Tax=Perkinsus olseni TaxID=32597 RepID=A0A7J6NMK2_PEROL|nr:hypothetical protein FOZ60_007407 [Perkinsus olseni]